MRLVGELERIEEVPEAPTEKDEYGLEWREHVRVIRLVGRREDDELVMELPHWLKERVVRQRRKLCLSSGYEWHFQTKVGERPLLITFGEEESKKIEGALKAGAEVAEV